MRSCTLRVLCLGFVLLSGMEAATEAAGGTQAGNFYCDWDYFIKKHLQVKP